MPEPVSTAGAGIIYKLVGAAAGSGLALSVLVPDHHKDAVVRAIVGVVGGFVFGPAAYHFIGPWIGDNGENWNVMAGSCAAGFVAWSVASVVARTMSHWTSLNDIKNSFKKPVPKKRRRKRKVKPKPKDGPLTGPIDRREDP
jgi:hypothetical protein